MTIRKMRPRKILPSEYIEQLRIKALLAFRHFDDSTVLKKNKSRDNYEPFHEMLKDKTEKEISTSALVEFFTKEPYWDEEEDDYVYNYEKYTVGAIEELVKLYENDTAGRVLPSAITERTLENIGSLLNELFFRNKTVSSITEKLVVEENGTCTIHTDVLMTVHSDIINVKAHYICDHPIKVKWIEAFDNISHERLEVFPYQTTKCSYIGFILFPKIINKNTTHQYRYSACIEGYYKGDLIDKKVAIEEINFIANKYKHAREEYHFPNTNAFRDLRVVIKSHPNLSLLDTEILPIIKDGYKIYVLNHGDVSKLKMPLRVELRNG